MAARVTSVFLYVKDVRRSLEFYNEVVGAEIVQVHAESEGAPLSLAIVRIGGFTVMLHPQEPHADEFTDTRVGVGVHLQIQVDCRLIVQRHILERRVEPHVGLLQRALSVWTARGERLEGDVRIEAFETHWIFTPRALWRAAEYRLVAASILEDVAGNRIGRSFEVNAPISSRSENQARSAVVPFRLSSGTR